MDDEEGAEKVGRGCKAGRNAAYTRTMRTRQETRDDAPDLTISIVPQLPHDVSSLESLRRIADHLSS